MGYKQYYTKKGDQVEIKIKDGSYNTVYKARVGMSDYKNLAVVLDYIEKAFGVKVSEAIDVLLHKEEKVGWFDST
jgi:hypothetical protein